MTGIETSGNIAKGVRCGGIWAMEVGGSQI